jgi:hypothetical protein
VVREGWLGQDQGADIPRPICPFINMDISVWVYRYRYTQIDMSIFIAMKMDISVWTYRSPEVAGCTGRPLSPDQ